MRKNFSLIELLIVVAVLSVLASMVMPSLRKASNAARRITCANNYKKLALVNYEFLNDNNEYFPRTFIHSSGGWWTWDDQFADYDGRNYSDHDKNQWVISKGSTQDQMESDYLLCPSDVYGPYEGQNKRKSYSITQWVFWISSGGDLNTIGVWPGISYFGWNGEESRTRRLSDINQPNKTFAFAENHVQGNKLTTPGHDAAPIWMHQNGLFQVPADQGHGLGDFNYLFVDSHVEFLSWPETYEGSASDPWNSGSSLTGSKWDAGK